MTIETLVAIFVAALVVKASPGPGVFATVGRALAEGFWPTTVFIAGIMVADCLFFLAAVFGLAIVAREMGEVFLYVRLAGVAFLFWLGVRYWLAPATPIAARPAARVGRVRSFLGGVLLTLGNPKVILLYLGLLPTFVDLVALAAADVALLAVIFLGILGSTLSAYAYAAASARRLFRSERAVKLLNRGAGTVLIGTGVAVAAR